MKKIDISKQNILLLLLSILVSCLFLITFAFSVNPFLLNTGGDSAVYQQNGLAIVLGKIPYVDIFEGKGFLLFLIQAIGLYISDGHWGLYFISVINLSVCVFLWFKTSRLYVSKKQSWIPVLFTLALIGLSFTSSKGNGTEFWSLPYISFSLYVLARYYNSNEFVSFRSCLFIGIGMGIITFIRMNNMAPICIVCLALLIDYLYRKEYKRLWKSIGCVFGGFVASCLFTILLFWWMYGTENLYYLFFGTFIYNLSYIGGFGTGSLLQLFFYISVLICAILVLCNYKKYKREVIFIIVAFAFTYLTMGKAYFTHYFEISFPLYIMAISYILDSEMYKKIPHKNYLSLACVAVAVIGITVITPQIKQRLQHGKVMETGLKDIKSKLLALPESDRDSIWNFNSGMDGSVIMQTISRIPMNRCLNNKLHASLKVEIKDIGTIQECRPLYIMTKDNYDKSEDDKIDSIYISSNYYEVFRTQMVMDGVSHVIFYKRNELTKY